MQAAVRGGGRGRVFGWRVRGNRLLVWGGGGGGEGGGGGVGRWKRLGGEDGCEGMVWEEEGVGGRGGGGEGGGGGRGLFVINETVEGPRAAADGRLCFFV